MKPLYYAGGEYLYFQVNYLKRFIELMLCWGVVGTGQRMFETRTVLLKHDVDKNAQVEVSKAG